METAIGIILGGIITILTTISVENLRKRRLALQIGSPADGNYQNRPARKARFLHVKVLNKSLPWWAKWMSRSAAIQCHGTISFHHLDDGQDVFGRAMAIRWSGSPEPVPSIINIDGRQGFLIDPSRFAIEQRWDIFPGESTDIDVASRFDDEEECYGWSNENYLIEPQWRNPRWKLSRGRYLVKITVVSAGERCTEVFRLINDVPQDAFRLEPHQQSDHVQ
ncbi:MAG: hypothetical protein M1358_18390 [Chloroflexi bacterium]|nr:hypothetical protein [Chloroflexota bacterium]